MYKKKNLLENTTPGGPPPVRKKADNLAGIQVNVIYIERCMLVAVGLVIK